MKAYVDSLVALYASHEVKEIQSRPRLIEKALRKSLRDLSRDSDFPEDRNFVESLKRRIENERATLSTPDTRGRIGACLRMLLDAAMFDGDAPSMRELKLNTMRDLFMAMFSKGWSKAQIKHFDFILGMLKKWNSFFLSYTNKDPKATNEQYKEAIDLHVPPEIRKSRDWEQDNIVAEAIIAKLRDENLLDGFYDKTGINIGDNLDDKIGPAAGGTFVFVQLVQLKTFSAQTPPNWPYMEYCIFTRLEERMLKGRAQYRAVFRKRFAAILTDNDRRNLEPAALPRAWRSWRDRIFEIQHHKTLPTGPRDFQQAIRNLALAILNVKHALIDCVPD